MTKRSIRRAAAVGGLALLIGLSLLAISCAERIDLPERPAGVLIKANLKADLYQEVRLTVSGPDMATITATMQQAGSYLQADVVIPPGPDRLFLIEAIGMDGRVVYRGEKLTGVVPGLFPELDITLLPVRPVLRIVPHFAEVLMDSTVDVDIEMHGLSNIGEVGLYFNIDPAYQNLAIDNAQLYVAMDQNYGFEWNGDSIWVSCIRAETCGQVTPLGDDGDVRLVTVTLRASDDWGPAVQEFEVGCTVTSLRTANYVSLPVDTLYADRAVVTARKSTLRQTTYDGWASDRGLCVVESDDGTFLIGGYVSRDMKVLQPADASPCTYYLECGDWRGGLLGAHGDRDSAAKAPPDKGPYISYRTYGYLGEVADMVSEEGEGRYSYLTGSVSGDGWHQLIMRVDGYGYDDASREWWSGYGETYGRAVAVMGTGCLTAADVPAVHRILLGLFTPIGDGVLRLNWSRLYGGAPGRYSAQALISLSNRDFVFAGSADTLGTADLDLYVCAADTSGAVAWRFLRGGAGDDVANDMLATVDGDLVLAGARAPASGADRDGWLLSLDADGGLLWERTFDVRGDDELHAVIAGLEGGYLAVGETGGQAGDRDVLVIRTDDAGREIWRRTFGGSEDDGARDVVATSDDDYLIVGYSWSFGDTEDLYLLKIDDQGR